MASSIDILVPGAETLVRPWYYETQAAADGMPPHLTLLWPWVEPVGDADILRLKAALADLEPFQIRLTATGRFPGVVYLAPEPVGQLVALARRIWSAFPEIRPYGGELDHEPILHLTAAKGTSDPVLDLVEGQLSARLPSAPLFPVDRVSVSQEGAGEAGRWGVVAEVHFGNRRTRDTEARGIPWADLG
ncbi:MAG TPA: 2'-5' RNA ligase family protein [Candidatus Acidoferrales bacterium]|nr:2'-5' RNA ligase family protein [Candidatus Acidoferrales bacterium]